MAKQRFSRDFVLSTIERRLIALETEFGFRRGWGYARVEGKPLKTIVAFGQYDALRDLAEDFETGSYALSETVGAP